MKLSIITLALGVASLVTARRSPQHVGKKLPEVKARAMPQLQPRAQPEVKKHGSPFLTPATKSMDAASSSGPDALSLTTV